MVPARNEARNLEIVLPRLPQVHEVIVVDGHSSDDTEAVVTRILPQARFVQQTRKGKGNALACGFENATGDVIVMFDADGSADAAEIEAYVTALRTGADFAKGSRVLAAGGSEDITWLRDAGNRALTTLTNLMFRTRYTDLCYGYNAFWRDVLPTLALPAAEGDDQQWGDGFEIETMINCRVAAGGSADPRGAQRRAGADPRREQPEHLARRAAGAPHDLHRALQPGSCPGLGPVRRRDHGAPRRGERRRRTRRVHGRSRGAPPAAARRQRPPHLREARDHVAPEQARAVSK